MEITKIIFETLLKTKLIHSSKYIDKTPLASMKRENKTYLDILEAQQKQKSITWTLCKSIEKSSTLRTIHPISRKTVGLTGMKTLQIGLTIVWHVRNGIPVQTDSGWGNGTS